MRTLFGKFASDDGSSWWTEAACTVFLVLLVAVPVIFHADPVATRMLFVVLRTLCRRTHRHVVCASDIRDLKGP